MNSFASIRFAANADRRLPELSLWARVTTAIASVVVSLTLLGAVLIGLTMPNFDLAEVAASAGRHLDPVVAAAQAPGDD